MDEKAGPNPHADASAEYDKEKKERLDALYKITGKGLKIISILLLAYMAVSVILVYFLHIKPSALIMGAVAIIAVAYPVWLYLVVRAARKIRKLKEWKV